jgi:hypothetical protein
MQKQLLLLLLFLFYSLTANSQKLNYYYSVQKKDSMGKEFYTLFSKFGDKVLDMKCDWISTNYSGWSFCWKEKLIRVYDSMGRYLNIDNIQEIQSTYANTSLIPLKRKGKWGYYSRQGKIQIKHKYEDATLFRNGKAAVKANGRIFYIDTNGKNLKEKYIASNEYSFEKLSTAVGLTTFYNMPQETFKKGDKLGLIEKATSKVLINAVYDGIFSISKDNVIVQLGEKYGVVDFSGKIIIPIEYEMIYLLD